MKIRKFKTFDLGYRGVQISLAIYALFVVLLAFGVRGLITIKQPMVPAIAAMTGCFLGASAYVFFYFRKSVV